MILTYTRRPPRAYVLAAVATGLAALAVSLPASARLLLEARYLLLAFCALTLGTRVYLKVPYAANAVPASAAFVLLTALLYGFEAATPLAAAAAVVSSLRLSRGGASLLHDSAPAAVVTVLVGWVAALLTGAAPGAAPAYAASLAALVFSFAQAAAESAQLTAYGRSGTAPRGAPRAYLDALSWTFTAYLLTSSFAVLAAQAPAGFVFDVCLGVAAAAAAVDALYHAHRGGASQPAHAWLGGRAQFEGTHAFGAAFEHAAIGMAVLSSKGKLLWVNRSLSAFLGYTESELMSASLKAITHKDDLGPALGALKSMLRQRSDFLQTEVRHQRRGGEHVWALWNVARFQDPRDDETYLVLQLQDVTERKQSEERLRHDAFHDPLTGLPNRALFTDHVKLTIARAKRVTTRRFAVLFCDLDRFKVINDSLGHVAGDQLLVEVARRLERCLRQGDTVARVGGDEFTILLDDLADEQEAATVAERIQKEIGAAIMLSGREVFTTMSIGVAAGTGSYSDPEDILRDADTAMYRAKSLGKARHVVFDHSMHASAVNLLQIETDLRKALEKGQFYLLYQPIVSLDNFKLCGFEALVRWHHPERGLISPLDFIPIAEETGQIIGIGEWALFEACRQMREWQEKFPQASPIFMSVNLSAKQFNHMMLIAQVDDVLRRTGLNPRQLKLEITEGAVMDNIDAATEMLRQLRDLGVQLAIDDFGTGYSSLSYLHRFPIDTLKIDRSFVTRMANNPENVEIVRTIVMLAQVLGMDVVAEGVETKEQLKLLRDLRCEYGQGYYFSRPSSAGDSEKIIVETNEKVRKLHMPEKARAEAPAPNDTVKTIRLVPSD
ncbi:MAG TPA: EAL domain-containing protein [Pyrinomonadaceae bacterium]|jgi:diguanylate cyclase (GGDEF)-like protein/PAS domain S-box-containing protein